MGGRSAKGGGVEKKGKNGGVSGSKGQQGYILWWTKRGANIGGEGGSTQKLNFFVKWGRKGAGNKKKGDLVELNMDSLTGKGPREKNRTGGRKR